MIHNDDLAEIQAFIEKDKAESARSGGSWFSIKEDGEYEIRVLKMANFKSGAHWDVVKGENGKGKTVLCPKVIKNLPCPICELVDELKESDDEVDQEKALKIEVQVKYPMVVIDTEDKDLAPKLYEAPKSVYYGIWDLIASKKGSYRDLLSFEKGRNVVIVRDSKSKKKYVDYSVVPAADRSSIEADIEAVNEILAGLEPMSYDDIVYAVETGELPETEEAPKKTTAGKSERFSKPAATKPTVSKYSKGLPAPKTRDEDLVEPEEEEVEEVEDEEIEEEAPAPKATLVKVQRPGLSQNLKNKISSMQKRG